MTTFSSLKEWFDKEVSERTITDVTVGFKDTTNKNGKLDDTIPTSSNEDEESQELPGIDWNQRKIFLSWILLCFSTGPVSSLTRTYVPAVIQSAARAVGQTSEGEKCPTKGNDCFVNFGTGKVHFTSYVIYLKAIYTALEGVVALLLMGIADFSHYRKWILIGSIVSYGIFSLPFAGLKKYSYSNLKGLSALYALLNINGAIYQILEASYIPLFMRAAAPPKGTTSEEVRRAMVMKKGSLVSVLGLVASNIGGIVALLIGIIITYSRGSPGTKGYDNFLLAITIAGCLTTVFGLISAFYIPSVKGKQKPKGFILFLSFKRMFKLSKEIRQFPNAFLLCVGWVLWNVTYTNFLTVFVLLFRSTLGIGTSDAEYTVYVWMSYVVASLGSLVWMYIYPKASMSMKTWAYIFLGFSIFTNFWGCLGISDKTAVGFKHRAEFWVFDIFYTATSSSLRSLNRVLYSTLLPEGEEAQYFGLEVMLGVAVSWIGTLVIATIQDRTGNDRYPFLPNLFLVAVSTVLYILCDAEAGMKQVAKIVESIHENENTYVSISSGSLSDAEDDPNSSKGSPNHKVNIVQ
ncbi:hypothetical protein WICMUC_005927 [Wickerhamomyces mucosus]|uniref:Autophagy-related protein n=1 Tax=Wickerhamomyces mucosus TaxID=1378264 RepID=A0A9P8P0B0_9ASCO|nr:hypothetical protein WICMUC_005927 [Wickerhamomyces mucosus]